MSFHSQDLHVYFLVGIITRRVLGTEHIQCFQCRDVRHKQVSCLLQEENDNCIALQLHNLRMKAQRVVTSDPEPW